MGDDKMVNAQDRPERVVRKRFVIKAFEQHNAPAVLATSITVNVPDGLTRQEAIDYVTGKVAGEVSRYFAQECLGISHDHPVEWDAKIT